MEYKLSKTPYRIEAAIATGFGIFTGVSYFTNHQNAALLFGLGSLYSGFLSYADKNLYEKKKKWIESSFQLKSNSIEDKLSN